MSSYLHSGVYHEEIVRDSHLLEGVATSVTAFVGFTYRGEVGVPKLIGKFEDYVDEFGPIFEEDPMGLAIRAFYQNGGGGSAYVCRLAADIGTSKNETNIFGAGTYNDIPNSRTPTTIPVLSIKASSPGRWGNNIRYKIEKDHRDSRFFTLLVGEFAGGEFKEQERYNNLSMNQDSADYVKTQVNDNSKLITLKVTANNSDYQVAKITGTKIPDIATVQAYLGDSNNNLTFMISVNNSSIKTISLAGIDTTSTATIAREMEDIIRRTLNTADITVTYNSGIFELKTSSQTPSSNILLLDSDLLTQLGLSSKNVATLRGGSFSSQSAPSITSTSDNFKLTLDQYEEIEIVFNAPFPMTGADIANEIQKQVNNAFPDTPSFSGFTCSYNTDIKSSNKTFFILTSGSIDVLESKIEVAVGASNDAALILKLASPSNPIQISGRTIQQGIDLVVPQIMLGKSTIDDLGERLHNGKDSLPIASDFTTFYNTTLRKFRDISILVVPGNSWNGGL